MWNAWRSWHLAILPGWLQEDEGKKEEAFDGNVDN
jgi:hypothetical protein